MNKEQIETNRNKQSLNYSKKQKKIHKSRKIRETPTLRPIKEPVGTSLTTKLENSQYPQKECQLHSI